MAKVKWLDRRIAAPGPYMTLVTSEAQYLAALKHLSATPGKWLSTPQADATTHLMQNSEKGLVAVVAINITPGRSGIEIAGLLVHKAVHIVQDYFDFIGERNPGLEQEAYAVQAVSQELMDAYANTLARTNPGRREKSKEHQ